MAEFEPKIDTSGFGIGVSEAPNIQYDEKEINPGIIEQQKWDIIYKGIIFLSLIIIIIINIFIIQIYNISDNISETKVKILDMEPIVKKIEQTTSGVNYDDLIINRYILENLFFVGDSNYEIIQKFRNFFINPKVQAQLGSFILENISLSGNSKNEDGLGKIGIKIEGHFSSFNKDVKGMISFLSNMMPIVIIQDINFSKGNKIAFTGYILHLDSKLLKYDYGTNYKKINELVRLKEEYLKNTKILTAILADKDIDLKKVGIKRIYNCKQYSNILQKQNLIKEVEKEQCNDVELLLKKEKKELDNKFKSLMK